MISKRNGLFISLFISLLFLAVVYKSAFFHPNRYLYCEGGDGLKSYFNFVSHIKNDTSFSKLSMIAYPYGESLLLEDCLPVLNSSLKVVAQLFPSITDYTVGILNLFVLLSLVVGVGFMYLIFYHFKLPSLIAVFSANVVGLLSSFFLLIQDRGQLGLSWVCFFPMGWFLLIQYFRGSRPIFWSILVALNCLFWAYIHVYLGMILITFTLLCHFFKISRKSFSLRISVLAAIQILFPIVFILCLIKLNDSHPDRIDMPFFSTYRASFYSVFMPVDSILKPFYARIFDLKPQDDQSWCEVGNYIGLCSNLAILCLLVLSIYWLIKKQIVKLKEYFSDDLWVYVLASVLILLFSMAIPLKYFPISLQNEIPLIRQFIAIGRFAWAFYFVGITFCILFWYKLLYKKLVGKIGFVILLAVYFLECSFHLGVSKDFVKSSNEFSKFHLSSNKRKLFDVKIAEFQAVLPLPIHYKYNLPFGNGHSDSCIYAASLMSYHTGLPMLSTILSRPSVSESMNIYTQFIKQPYRCMNSLMVANKKDIAVLVYFPDSTQLTEGEKEVLSLCSLVKKVDNYGLFRLSIENLAKRNPTKQFAEIEPKLFHKKGFLVTDTSLYLFYNAYDSCKSEFSYRGSGAFRGKKTDYNFLLKTSTSQMDTSKEYVLSFWYYNYIWEQTFTSAIIEEVDNTGKNIQYECYSPLKTNIIDHWWYFSEKRFKVKSTKSELHIFLNGNNYFEDWFMIDEVLIRRSDLDVYKVEGKRIYKNNQQID